MSRMIALPACVASLVFLLTAPMVNAREMVSVDRPKINMREGAGKEFDAVWSLEKGYPLQVTGRRGNWLKVRDFENDRGWVYRPLVDKTPHYVVKAAVANIRRAPSGSARIVGRAEKGEVLRTLGHRNGWVQVAPESGANGWVARRLLWGW